MREINNIQQLEKVMQSKSIQMTDKLAERVYQILNYFLNDYYTGWTPSSYKRTQDFLRSAVKVKARRYGNTIKACVYIDYKALNNYENVTGLQVVTWANEGFHGGLTVEHKPHVWDDTIENTVNNGMLLQMAKKYLENNGFTVTVQ